MKLRRLFRPSRLSESCPCGEAKHVTGSYNVIKVSRFLLLIPSVTEVRSSSGVIFQPYLDSSIPATRSLYISGNLLKNNVAFWIAEKKENLKMYYHKNKMEIIKVLKRIGVSAVLVEYLLQ